MVTYEGYGTSSDYTNEDIFAVILDENLNILVSEF